jgi:hypothetical protein
MSNPNSVIEEVKNAVECAKAQEGEAISCTAEWLEMVLEELEAAQRFRRLVKPLYPLRPPYRGPKVREGKV